ncbi:MAG: hypothetical protein KDB53_16660, partial [Planctomycetes bacterium]|nr:hypothetical protein [Planctomycetota bacterium]
MTMRWAVVLLAVLAGGASGQGRVDRVFQVLRPAANQGLDSDSQKCEALSALEISDLYFAWRGVMSAAAFEEGSRFATPLTPAERTLVVEAAQSNSPELLRASLRTLVLGDAPIADRIGAAQFLAEVSPGQGVDFVLEILAGIEPTHLAGGSVAKALTRVVVGMLQREPQNA